MVDAAPARRFRTLGWLASVALLLVYWALSEGDDAFGPQASPRALSAVDAQRLTITEVTPNDPTPGSALAVSIAGNASDARARLWIGKTELTVLARRPEGLVAQLPSDLAPGRVKIRATAGSERSKTFELRVKPTNWRKPFRNLCGGLALLMLGVQALSRGARGVLGFANAQRMAAITRPRFAAASFGVVAGAITQSTTAVAGMLAGLVSSRALSELAAAAVFLGATLGAALAPLALASVAEPRWGLPVIAIATWLFSIARDRRSKAGARVLLGVGLVAYGVQVLRPDFEPFVSNGALLGAVERIAPGGLLGTIGGALLGALLVAVFQGPAPVLVLALGIAELTGRQSARSLLALLAGSGLGAALVALLTTYHGRRGRRLAQLNLLAGAGSTLLTAATVDLFARVSDRLAAGPAHPIWNGKHLLPALAWPVVVAFALSQLMAALVLLPLLPLLSRLAERIWPERAALELSAPLAVDAVRAGLTSALGAQHSALPAIVELSLHGLREAGRTAEHRLVEASAALESLFEGPVLALPATVSGSDLGQVALACRQLQRGLEEVLEQAERLTESRILSSARVLLLSEPDQQALREMHGLVEGGLTSVLAHLRAGTPPDPDETRAREIRLNATESRTRHALLADGLESHDVQQSLSLIELIDAYEMAGNQLYRLAETLNHAQQDGPGPGPSKVPASSTTSETGRV